MSESPASPASKPIRELSTTEILSLDEFQLSGMRLIITGTGNLKTLEALRNRMLDYIHFQTCFNTPPKLATLNRRFGRPARALDTTSAQVVEALVMLKAVQVFEGQNTVIMSHRCLAERQEYLGAQYIEARDTMLANAQ